MSHSSAVAANLGRYLARSVARVDHMQELVTALYAAPGDGEALREMRDHFHRFSGSGGTYGLPDVTTLGRQGERDCELLIRSQVPVPAPSLERWEGLLAALRAQLGGAPAPAVAAPSVELAGRVASPSPIHQTESTSVSPEILVVDDDEDLHSMITHQLTQEGFRVRVARTKEEALELLRERLPQGLITDIRLPDGSGYEVVEHLRGMNGGEKPGVLIVSGLSGFLDKVEAIRCGADGYFEKPVDWEALMRRMQHLLDNEEIQQACVLYVEDDPDQAAFVRHAFEAAGYRMRICDTPEQFDDDLIAFRPDLVLMDLLLPGIHGFDLVRYLRQDESYATLPVIFLTGQGQLELKVETIRAGADDLLVKPVPAELLIAAVAARIERARFLKSLMDRDGLTRLLTHTAFIERAKGVAGKKQRMPEKDLAFVMVDIDHFKAVNDRYGHPVGDRVLASLAALLRRRLRQSDIVGRYGGEEFAVIIEDLRQDEAVRLVSRLLDEFAAITFETADGQTFSCSFSAGVAMLESDGDLESWKREADAALYQAKRAGRRRVLPAIPAIATELVAEPTAAHRGAA